MLCVGMSGVSAVCWNEWCECSVIMSGVSAL